MAISNTRSSAYRAGGGWKGWGRVSSGDHTIKMDAPKPAHIERHLQERADLNDEYHLTKARVRDTLADDCEGVPVTVIPEGKRAKKKRRK